MADSPGEDDGLKASSEASADLLESYIPKVLATLAAIGMIQEQVLALGTSLAKQLAPVMEQLAPALETLSKIDWDAAKRRLDELPAKSKEAMKVVSARGWFFGWHDSLQSLMELIETLQASNPENLDDVMASYYRANITQFGRELTANYPQRSIAIDAAINAHHNLGTEGYLLSIPVFIAQADGLLTEIAGTPFSALQRDKRTKELAGARYLRERLEEDQRSLDLISSLLGMHDTDFMKSVNERSEFEQKTGTAFAALNRHQVMHGEVSNYGTEINSLKAFSFLTFVGLHLPSVLRSDASD